MAESHIPLQGLLYPSITDTVRIHSQYFHRIVFQSNQSIHTINCYRKGGSAIGGQLADKTKVTTESMHITPAGANVFVDLGFCDEQAAALQAESRIRISQKLNNNSHTSYASGSHQTSNSENCKD